MGIFMNDSFHNLSVFIRDCIYEKNFARSFGGGFYMVFNGFNTQHSVFVEGTHLLSNTGGVGGGGIQVAYIASGVPTAPHTANISDCEFRNNASPSGGGIYVYPSFLGELRGASCAQTPLLHAFSVVYIVYPEVARLSLSKCSNSFACIYCSIYNLKR